MQHKSLNEKVFFVSRYLLHSHTRLFFYDTQLFLCAKLLQMFYVYLLI